MLGRTLPWGPIMTTDIETIGEIEADMQRWRHDIHAHPETAFEEVRTSQVVADLLFMQVHAAAGKSVPPAARRAPLAVTARPWESRHTCNSHRFDFRPHLYRVTDDPLAASRSMS